jgi:hypothetical protein
VRIILETFERHDDAFVILVCGFETTAVLHKSEVVLLLPAEGTSNSSITIRTGHDKKLAVSGTLGELKTKVAKTRTYERLLNSINTSEI